MANHVRLNSNEENNVKRCVEEVVNEPIQEISIVDNNIYFYASVEERQVLNLTKEIKVLETRFLYEKISRNQEFASPINLHILSGGGESIAGLAAMDTIISCKVPINTIIDGYCASAATFMSIVGKKRYMRKNAFMLIHQMSSSNDSLVKYYEKKDEMQNLDLFMNIFRNIYKKYTKIPPKKLNEILKHDLYWNAETCLKYGLIDEIL